MGKSILITNRDTNIKNIAFPVPWHSDGDAFNMKIPSVSVNVSNYNNMKWIETLGNLEDITSLFIDCDLEETSDYEFIAKLSNLSQLYIYTAKNLSDISFIQNCIKKC